MALSLTFDTLKTALKERIGDKSTSFDTNLAASIIPAGETRLLRDLNFTLWDTVDTFTISVSTATATVPTGALQLNWVYYTSGTTRLYLYPRSLQYIRDFGADTSVTGLPQYYAPVTETTIELAPIPGATYTATTQFIKRPTGLSSSTSTTWLSTNVPDCLLYACLIEAEVYGVGDERVAGLVEQYAALVLSAQKEFRTLVRPKMTLE